MRDAHSQRQSQQYCSQIGQQGLPVLAASLQRRVEPCSLQIPTLRLCLDAVLSRRCGGEGVRDRRCRDGEVWLAVAAPAHHERVGAEGGQGWRQVLV